MVLIKKVTILMMSAKLATLGLLKIKVSEKLSFSPFSGRGILESEHIYLLEDLPGLPD